MPRYRHKHIRPILEMSTKKNLDEQRCDYLVLLVGTNPLPNWVAARLLTKPKSKVHLLCTAEVFDQTRRLKEALQSDPAHPLSVDWIETDGADERKIYDVVSEKAEEIRRELEKAWQEGRESSVGLNYTGGTKMMSVHAHHALRDVFANLPRERQPIFSYLNAGDLKMRFDSDVCPEPKDISNLPAVCLSAEMLFRLHNNPKKFKLEILIKDQDSVAYLEKSSQQALEQPVPFATRKRVARGLALIHSHKAGQKAWGGWYKELKQKNFSPVFTLPTETELQKDIAKHLESV